MYEGHVVCLTWMLLCSSRQSFWSDLTPPQRGLFCTHNWSSWAHWVSQRVYRNYFHCSAVALSEHQGVVLRGHEHITLLSTRRQAAITHFKLGAHVTEKNVSSEHQSSTFLSSNHFVCHIYQWGNRGKLQPQKVATKDWFNFFFCWT